MNYVDGSPGILGRALNALGVIIVGYSFITQLMGEVPVWVSIAAIAALAAWTASLLLPRGWDGTELAILIVMAVAGALATAPTVGLLIAPVVVAVLRAVSATRFPLGVGIGVALLSLALVPVGTLAVSISAAGLASMLAGIGVAALGGFSRRQYRTSAEQARVLAEERLRVREESARAQVLDERQSIARDLHDVLAHSLGGLVIQLDAVEALLEAGRPGEAAIRVAAARTLAVSGLDEARLAMGALRDRDAAAEVSGETLDADLSLLSAEHSALGGTIAFRTIGTPVSLGEEQATALRRALQEALTNARKHAPDSPVDATLVWTGNDVTLTVSNDLPAAAGAGARAGAAAGAAAPLAGSGGQFGLSGMRERFAGVARGGVVAGAHGERFVVSATVGLNPQKVTRS